VGGDRQSIADSPLKVTRSVGLARRCAGLRRRVRGLRRREATAQRPDRNRRGDCGTRRIRRCGQPWVSHIPGLGCGLPPVGPPQPAPAAGRPARASPVPTPCARGCTSGSPHPALEHGTGLFTYAPTSMFIDAHIWACSVCNDSEAGPPPSRCPSRCRCTRAPGSGVGPGA
jgi:hypothetical protein